MAIALHPGARRTNLDAQAIRIGGAPGIIVWLRRWYQSASEQGRRRWQWKRGTVVGRDLGPSAGFATVALNGGYRFNDQIRLTAGVDNIFGRLYSEHMNLAGSADFGYPADPVRIHEPGRNVWLKLNMSY